MYPTVVNTTYTSGAMESTMHCKVGVLRVVAVSLEAAVEKKSRLRCWYRPHNPGLPPPPSGGERGETFYTGESVLFNTPSVCRHQPDKRCRPVCVNRFPPKRVRVIRLRSRHRLFTELALDTHTNPSPKS